ncbi:MAG: hypothetical protein J6S53_02660 [Lentisphaeria bacterium]|nr:hypothetical protein [Lentisphaeria bacterium]
MSITVHDNDLNPIIEIASNEELQFLVDVLTKTMTNGLTSQEEYKKFSPDHRQYANLIAKEIREFGGNSFANIWRKEGPAYKEIVCDVAKALKAPFNKESSIEHIENAILETVLSKALEDMTDAEKQTILKELEKDNKLEWKNLTGPSLTSAIILLFKSGGFAGYQLAVMIMKAIATSIFHTTLPFIAYSTLTKSLSIVFGPVGWIITGAWAAVDIAGPAKRITIPCVIYIAMLRKRAEMKLLGRNDPE